VADIAAVAPGGMRGLCGAARSEPCGGVFLFLTPTPITHRSMLRSTVRRTDSMTETKIIVRHPRPPPSGRMSMFPKRMMCCPQRCARMLGLWCRHEGIQRGSLSRSRDPEWSTFRGEPINIGMGTTFRARRRRADVMAQSGLVQPGSLVLGRDGLGLTDQAVTALPVRSPGHLFRCNRGG
jgi:hypothetical protein